MATKSIAWNTGSGNIALTYNGQGDGTITVQSDANNLGSARSQVITIETVGGAISRGFTISQAACPFPVGDVKNFSYTGSYQEVELPAGQYKLQCWGAQGGSNAAASSYSITAKAGGKGGYSEGIITLSQKTTVRIYVGGQGSSSAGGFNGGGSTTGSASYNSDNEQGVSRMGGGGGATDIRLSDGALLSRMIVAGGGAGGAMCYRAVALQKTASHSWNPSSSGTLTHAAVSSSTDWDVSSTFGGKIVRAKITTAMPIYIGGTSKGTLNTAYILFDFRNYSSVQLRLWGGAPAVTIDYQIYNSELSTLPVKVVSSYTGVSIGEYYTIDYTSIYLRAGTNGAFALYPNASSGTDIYYKPSGSETFVIDGYAYKWQNSKLTVQYEEKTASHSWNPSSSGTLTHAGVTSNTDWDVSSTVAGKIVRMKVNNPLSIFIGGTQKGTLTTAYILFDFRNYSSVVLRMWGGTAACTIDYQIYNSELSTLPVNVVSSYTGVSVGEYYTIDYGSVFLRTGTYGAVSLYPTASSGTDIYYKPSGSETFVIGGYAYKWQDNQLTIQYETTGTTDYQVGGVGGGTQGGAYFSTYAGKQNAAGTGGSFGQGANQTANNYRYCSGAGGGGWYGGGGGQTSNSSMTYCKYNGGGSGFVNTAASAGNRPSGYTGPQLDSGSTVDGEQTFEAPTGGTEIGHTGNGYARITRLN